MIYIYNITIERNYIYKFIIYKGNYIEDPFGGKKEVEVVPVDELTYVIKNNMEETLNLVRHSQDSSSASQSSNIYYTSTNDNSNNPNKNGTDASDIDIIESISLFQ